MRTMVGNLPQLKEKQMIDEFLLKELFTNHTKVGKLPSTIEEYEGLYSQKEYEVILKGVLYASGLIKGGG